jgi:hypothetical protein
MFPRRYFAARFYAPRYFPIGGVVVIAEVIRDLTLTARALTLKLNQRSFDLSVKEIPWP